MLPATYSVPPASSVSPCRPAPRSAARSVPVTKRSPPDLIVRVASAPPVVTSPAIAAAPGTLTSAPSAVASMAVASPGVGGIDGAAAAGDVDDVESKDTSP